MQEPIKFAITSEQCELLASFEAAGSLAALAKVMHRDVSVVSRNLQSLADTGVLEKASGRWVLTALGRQINQWTRTVAASQLKILDQQSRLRMRNTTWPAVTPDTALILVGVQRGFDDPRWGTRNNLHAEDNISKLLGAWRRASRPVYHIQHQSKEPASPLRPGTIGAEFKELARPLAGEQVLKKTTNSAFVGTPLETMLRERSQSSLAVAGFTTNHCVDATVRMAGDLGFSVFVVADACVAFDRIALDGGVVKASDTHRVVMANLNQEVATVLDTDTLLTCADKSSETDS